jgi:RNA polymerase sigma-70 factor, ECF subfamily
MAAGSNCVRSKSSDPAALAGHLFRRAGGRIAARLARHLGPARLSLVEDCVAEAFAAAVSVWRIRGIPENAEAWLTRTAKNKAIDRLRRLRKWEDEGQNAEALAAAIAEVPDMLDSAVDEDQLRLLFVACDPALPEAAQAALALKIVCGFGTAEIARLLLAAPDAVERRIGRAKETIHALGLKFEAPDADAARGRRASVLRALYLMFASGHHAGAASLRDDLCAEALRLARHVADDRALGGGDAQALTALFAFQAARLPARAGLDVVLMADQDRALWDRALIAEGVARLQRAMASEALTPWHLEAGIASVHAMARHEAETDWPTILRYYDLLLGLTPTAVVRLNRAVALLMAGKTGESGAELAALGSDPSMPRHLPFHAARAELALRQGQTDEAIEALRAALSLEPGEAGRRFLEARLAACEEGRA